MRRHSEDYEKDKLVKQEWGYMPIVVFSLWGVAMMVLTAYISCMNDFDRVVGHENVSSFVKSQNVATDLRNIIQQEPPLKTEAVTSPPPPPPPP
eukprot:CAMPEP_0113719156 /NCGR_PEP_ID=MMETSP0038_2-20120614/35630_1 /TAXON_ID=2898 /ORGANISM="Cryptomonas paramecium" /LENGTH=93 /DNA_ID=CAMNT_0000647441 /DNA_START=28 /DNA_END=305 /DNA_ORIENTATION=- /assembly_acc=CAM_ASM_000170